MSPRLPFWVAVVAVLIVAVTLTACGGGGSSANGGAAASEKDAARDAKTIERLRRQTFGVNDKARSGRLDATFDIDVKGVRRFKDPISVSQSGPFSLSDGAAVPDFKQHLSLTLRDKAYGADLILVDRRIFIQLGTTAYEVPDAIAAKIIKPASAADNGLTKSLAVFFVASDRWEKNARIVGDERLAGVDVVHLRTGVRSKRVFLDLSRLTRMLTSLRFTEIAGLPTAIGPRARAALVRSVKSARGDVWIGKSDHVLRKTHLEMRLAMSKADRRRLGGIKSVNVVADLNVSDIGKPQQISVPTNLGSYQALQLTFDVLAEAVEKDARRAR